MAYSIHKRGYRVYGTLPSEGDREKLTFKGLGFMLSDIHFM